MTQETQRINRYRSQSFRLLENAFNNLRGGKWLRSEDLLWGSLSLAVKAVALSRGTVLEDDAAVRGFAAQLGQDNRDRRLREAFEQLDKFSDTVQQVRESRSRADNLVVILEDVSAAVEALWEMVPGDDQNLSPKAMPEDDC